MWQIKSRLNDRWTFWWIYLKLIFSVFSNFLLLFIYLVTSRICQTQDWVFCSKNSVTDGIIKSTHVCRSSVEEKEEKHKPLSRRSFQFQYCSPRNQSRVRMPRRTRNTLPFPLCRCCITLTPIRQIRRGFRRSNIELRQTWDCFTSKYPSRSTVRVL